MELALNLVWLLLAISSLALAGWRLFLTARSKELQAPELHSLIALCCTLVILFFVISMTDDIHDQQISPEDSQSYRLLPRDGFQDPHGKHSHRGHYDHGFCATSESDSIAFIYEGHVEPLHATDSDIRRATLLSSRDPPLRSP